MTWKEVREKFPNLWVKLNILEKHVEDNKEYIDNMEVISTIATDLEAGRELVKCTENEVVYHTSQDEIYVEIRNIFGFRVVR
ncbi:MAG: hypothetical protein Q8942_02560 [Bacillota bacterium]|nr:hypothetical protein [Bacillota bacterium]